MRQAYSNNRFLAFLALIFQSVFCQEVGAVSILPVFSFRKHQFRARKLAQKVQAWQPSAQDDPQNPCKSWACQRTRFNLLCFEQRQKRMQPKWQVAGGYRKDPVSKGKKGEEQLRKTLSVNLQSPHIKGQMCIHTYICKHINMDTVCMCVHIHTHTQTHTIN